jgi:hypothetical protein
MGGQVFVSLRFYLFGDRASDAVAQAEPEWWAWAGEHFPMPAEMAEVS